MLWKDTKQTAVNGHSESHLASFLRTGGAERERWRTYACGSCLWTWLLRRPRDSETPRQLLRSTCRSLPRRCGSSADSGERRTARTNHNTTEDGRAYEFTVKSHVERQEVSLHFPCAEITDKSNQSFNYSLSSAVD